MRAPHGIALAAIGASAGGVEALLRILGDLPPRFRLPIVVVLHLPDERTSHLAELFGQRLALTVHEATAGEPILPGHLYFAPPGYHLLVEADQSLSLSCEGPVLFSRPSIDVLLDSAAHAYRERLAAMLLTGASADGAAGLAKAGALGGFTAVQDPASAKVATMPAAALALWQPDRVLDLPGLHRLLIELDETSIC